MKSKIEILFSPESNNDLELIFDYTLKKWSYKQAAIYVSQIFDEIEKLKIFPELGHEYTFAKDPYRKLLINKHLIFYRIENELITVVRILHEQINVSEQLK